MLFGRSRDSALRTARIRNQGIFRGVLRNLRKALNGQADRHCNINEICAGECLTQLRSPFIDNSQLPRTTEYPWLVPAGNPNARESAPCCQRKRTANQAGAQYGYLREERS